MIDDAFKPTAAGVLVPTDRLEKTRRVMLEMTFTRLKRALKLAKAEGLIALFFCRTCEKPVEIQHEDQLVETVTDGDGKDTKAGGGRFSLSCGCTVWAIR